MWHHMFYMPTFKIIVMCIECAMVLWANDVHKHKAGEGVLTIQINCCLAPALWVKLEFRYHTSYMAEAFQGNQCDK